MIVQQKCKKQSGAKKLEKQNDIQQGFKTLVQFLYRIYICI